MSQEKETHKPSAEEPLIGDAARLAAVREIMGPRRISSSKKDIPTFRGHTSDKKRDTTHYDWTRW